MKRIIASLLLYSAMAHGAGSLVGNWAWPEALEYIVVAEDESITWCHIHDYYWVSVTKGRLQAGRVVWEQSKTYDWETGLPNETNFFEDYVGKSENIFVRKGKLFLSASHKDEYTHYPSALPNDCTKYF